MKRYASHGSGELCRERFRRLGENVVFETGVLVFHPENIEIEGNVYVGHYAILKGYHTSLMRIGSGTWIGQGCFLHSGGGLTVGRDVGIGPGVKIITSIHDDPGAARPLMEGELRFQPVVLEDGCDLGVGAIILPGVTVGRGAQVGAGAVVARDVAPQAIVAGVPAREIGQRRP